MKSNTEKKELKKIEISASDFYTLCRFVAMLLITNRLLSEKVRELQNE